MLHYNFPPYSVGEVGRGGFTSRREIGHGKLAWRAVHPMLPSSEKFPYHALGARFRWKSEWFTFSYLKYDHFFI